MSTHPNSPAQPKLPGLDQGETKHCTKCEKMKPLSAFGNNRSTTDRLQSWCKKCQAAYQRVYVSTENGREKMLHARKKWAQKPGNLAKIRDATKRWLSTKEGAKKNRECQQRYFQSERGKEKLRIANERLRQAGYYKFGKGKISLLRSFGKKRGLGVELTAEELEKWWKVTADACNYCGQSAAEYRVTRDRLLCYSGTDRQILLLRGLFKRLKQASTNELTLDRVDNRKGYATSNLAKACWLCNYIKGAFLTDSEMKQVGARLRREIEVELGEQQPLSKSDQESKAGRAMEVLGINM